MDFKQAEEYRKRLVIGFFAGLFIGSILGFCTCYNGGII